jgi:putative FmdB family regulatory protein
MRFAMQEHRKTAMPIYEYQCQACGHRLETIQKVSDPLLSDCPQCEAPQLKKLVSGAAGSF